MQTTLLPAETATPMAIAAVAAPPTPMGLIEKLIESGRDPGEMLTIYERWEAGIAADAYGQALAAFQAKCPQIQKTRQIDLGGGKGPLFASYDDIMHVIKPILAECGIVVSFSADMTEGGQLRATCFTRVGRHSEHCEVTLPVPSQMRVNDTQKMGAALSYAKRYALCAALNITVSDEDRDGEGMVETISEEHLATLREWIANTESNESAFLKYMGVAKLADIAVGDFGKALDALKRKAKK